MHQTLDMLIEKGFLGVRQGDWDRNSFDLMKGLLVLNETNSRKNYQVSRRVVGLTILLVRSFKK